MGQSHVDDLAFYVSEIELSEETFKLLKIIREILICLSLAVGIEEEVRNGKSNSTKLVFPVRFIDYDDEWKR